MHRGPGSVAAFQCRYWLVVLALLGLPWPSLSAAATFGSDAAPVLTKAQQVLGVSLERARTAPVRARLRGVVTHPVVFAEHWVFVQDDTAGLLVSISPPPFPFAPGQLVEVEGAVMAGLFSPYVRAQQVRLVGTAPLPEPRHTPLAQLAAGADFGQWMGVAGTVRDVAITKNRLVLICAAEGLHFQVWITAREPMPLPAELLDARVEFLGVAWTETDADVKATGFRLHQSGTNYFKVLKPGSADIFRGAARTAQSLRQYASGANPDARVKVTGVVTLHSPDGWLALKDQTGVVRARQFKPLARDEDPRGQFLPRDLPQLQPGDRVELVGAPVAGHPFAPELEDAEYRRMGPGPGPAPRPVSSTDLMLGRHDAELVTLKARVADVESHHNLDLFEEKLWLQTESTVIEALLESHAHIPLAVRKDDFVAVTGVCTVEAGQFQQVRSVRLRLRGPDDLVITYPPPWWTMRWAAWLLAGGGAIFLTGGIWITALRRQVGRHTAKFRNANQQLTEEAQKRRHAEDELRCALAAEKELNQLKSNFVSMVSHEFRTPLGAIQSSAELLQNYSARLTPERRAKLLRAIVDSTGEMARMMEDILLFSSVESGRYEFRPLRLSLAEVCRRFAAEVSSASRERCPIHVQVGPLPETTWCDERLLRHILNNLLSNAVKYSPAGTPVDFQVERSGIDAIFTVRDHGVGIPVEEQGRLFQAFTRGSNVGDSPGTGLGLVIVHRSVRLLGGKLRMESAPGAGTTVTVLLPLFVDKETETAVVRRWREAAQTMSA